MSFNRFNERRLPLHPVKPTIDTPRIGVFGAAFAWNNVEKDLAIRAGVAIAHKKCITVTGMTTGLSHFAAQASRRRGGFVIGVSPVANAREHVERYGKPLDACDLPIWTGNGYTGRNYLNLRNCDGAIFIGGEYGTLEEFCIGNYEGKVLGVVEGSGGVTSCIRGIIRKIRTNHGAVVLFNRMPEQLVFDVIDTVRERVRLKGRRS